WENRNSPAPYQNADRYMRTAPPAGVSADLEPDWVKRSDAPRAAWHDHRIHWMSPDLPPIVAENPARETVVNREWQVPYLHGGQELVVRGQLRWIPGPSPWPWVLAGLALTAPALTGLRRRPASDGRWLGLVRPAAVVLAAVAALNLVHVAHALLEAPLPLASRLLGVGQTGVFVGLAAFGALRGSQAREGGFAALGIGSAALLFGAGLLYLPLLGASQISGVLPAPATRMIVGLSIAQALPVGAVAAIGSRRAVLAGSRSRQAGTGLHVEGEG
ncbi:MAG TPA: hypothetical protein VML96_09395, partial [Egibacteraceae bacterium]|nr:hypothetical protein [Egibacteraceae bacterium]